MLPFQPVARLVSSPPPAPTRAQRKSLVALGTIAFFVLATVANAKQHRGQKPSAADAARFLTQSTFGPTNALIAQVQKKGFAWFLNQQFATAAAVTLPRVDQAIAALPTGTDPSNSL